MGKREVLNLGAELAKLVLDRIEKDWQLILPSFCASLCWVSIPEVLGCLPRSWVQVLMIQAHGALTEMECDCEPQRITYLVRKKIQVPVCFFLVSLCFHRANVLAQLFLCYGMQRERLGWCVSVRLLGHSAYQTEHCDGSYLPSAHLIHPPCSPPVSFLQICYRLALPFQSYSSRRSLSTQPSVSLASGSLFLPSQPWGSPLSLAISLCSVQTFAKSPFMKLSSNCPNLSVPSVSHWEADL